jgi:formylglycine-generating enzyme required for sulfatase activity
MTEKDYYHVLGLLPNAEQEAIQGAYRGLSNKYHPDHNPSPNALERMQEINEAYETLGDPVKRAVYDKRRRDFEVAQMRNESERVRREAEERQRREAQEKARQEAETRQRRETEERRQQEMAQQRAAKKPSVQPRPVSTSASPPQKWSRFRFLSFCVAVVLVLAIGRLVITSDGERAVIGVAGGMERVRLVPTPHPVSTADVELALSGITRNSGWTPASQIFNGVEMVLVPAGCFMMGNEDGVDDEKPVHQQCFDEPFWIDKYEVTNAQYGSVGCEEWSSEPNQPRNCIGWFDAKAYCESRGGRLPSEAEWEYAARGPDNLEYPWGNDFVADNVVYGGYSGGAAVGSRPDGVSWVGAMDMSGNLWEWTSSIYQDYPYKSDDGREDSSDTNNLRVFRGGAFSITFPFVRSTGRSFDLPNKYNNLVGFRCVRDFDPSDLN